MTNELFSLLLRDAALLLTPLFVTELTTSPGSTTGSDTMVRSHSHSISILALSDLYDMFSIECEQGDDKKRTAHRRGNHITHKLIFYAAHILSTPSGVLRTLVQEMIEKAEMIEQEFWFVLFDPFKLTSQRWVHLWVLLVADSRISHCRRA